MNRIQNVTITRTARARKDRPRTKRRPNDSRSRRLARRATLGDVWAVEVNARSGPRLFIVRGRGRQDALLHCLDELNEPPAESWDRARVLPYVPLDVAI